MVAFITSSLTVNNYIIVQFSASNRNMFGWAIVARRCARLEPTFEIKTVSELAPHCNRKIRFRIVTEKNDIAL